MLIKRQKKAIEAFIETCKNPYFWRPGGDTLYAPFLEPLGQRAVNFVFAHQMPSGEFDKIEAMHYTETTHSDMDRYCTDYCVKIAHAHKVGKNKKINSEAK